MQFSLRDIQAFDSRYRAHLINGMTGYKCLHLLGSADENGIENLAVISSVVHLGADPAMVGFVMRPDTVRRDSLTNIKKQKQFTLNSVNENNWQSAHHTSASFDPEASEFDLCGFKVETIDNFSAPFVQSSDIKMGFILEAINPLPNDTCFVIGLLQHLLMKDDLIHNDGFVDLHRAKLCVSSGLDSYHLPQPLGRLSYASSKEVPTVIDYLKN